MTLRHRPRRPPTAPAAGLGLVSGLSLVFCTLSAPAEAQAPANEPPATEQAPEPAPGARPDDEANQAPEAARDSKKVDSTSGDDELADRDLEETVPAPPPAMPTMADQTPLPYLPKDESDAARHRASVGPDFGVMARPSAGDNGDFYDPGLTWGVHVRMEGPHWLGVRLQFLKSKHGINAAPNELFAGAANLDLGDLVVHQLSARIEPTWQFAEQARAWVGVGIGWGRIEAPGLRIDDIELPRRVSTMVEYPFELGASVELIDGWLALSGLFTAALVNNQRGDVFRSATIVDGTGQLRQVDGLPKFRTGLGGILSIELML